MTFAKKLKSEIQHISWPDKKEVRKSTFFVLMATVILSLVTAMFNGIFEYIISFVLSLF